jgi:hypothetical protein
VIRFFDDNQAALAELNIDATLAALLRTSLGCAGLASRISSAQSDRFAYAAAPALLPASPGGKCDQRRNRCDINR